MKLWEQGWGLKVGRNNEKLHGWRGSNLNIPFYLHLISSTWLRAECKVKQKVGWDWMSPFGLASSQRLARSCVGQGNKKKGLLRLCPILSCCMHPVLTFLNFLHKWHHFLLLYCMVDKNHSWFKDMHFFSSSLVPNAAPPSCFGYMIQGQGIWCLHAFSESI